MSTWTAVAVSVVLLVFSSPLHAETEIPRGMLHDMTEVFRALDDQNWAAAAELSETFIDRHEPGLPEQVAVTSEHPYWQALDAMSIANLVASQNSGQYDSAVRSLERMRDRVDLIKLPSKDDLKITAKSKIRGAIMLYAYFRGARKTLEEEIVAAFKELIAYSNGPYVRKPGATEAAVFLKLKLALFINEFGMLPTGQDWSDFVRQNWSTPERPAYSLDAMASAFILAKEGKFNEVLAILKVFEQQRRRKTEAWYTVKLFGHFLEGCIHGVQGDRARALMSFEDAMKIADGSNGGKGSKRGRPLLEKITASLSEYPASSPWPPALTPTGPEFVFTAIPEFRPYLGSRPVTLEGDEFVIPTELQFNARVTIGLR